MAVGSGVLLLPNYAEDIKYPAYNDRLMMKSMGIQAGVVESEDFKVSAGTGLQVNVKSGKALVEQTKAIEESSNTFYNGLYNVLNPIEQNPYNNVEVSAANPQIAQIILRVYDVGELKIGGESYVRIEWLNGTPNAGATKLHIEEEKASEYGAAVLPQSSFRLCYVLVPKNSTKSSEFSIFDKRSISSRFPLRINESSSESRANSGELIVARSEITVIAPNFVQNAIFGVFALGGKVIINVSPAFVYGDFTEGSEQITISKNQHIILQAIEEVEKKWLIIAGEPKREWKSVSVLAGWGTGSIEYMMGNQIVYMRGFPKTSAERANGSLVATLPSGFRPATKSAIAIPSSTGGTVHYKTSLIVETNGEIKAFNEGAVIPNSEELFLNGSFITV